MRNAKKAAGYWPLEERKRKAKRNLRQQKDCNEIWSKCKMNEHLKRNHHLSKFLPCSFPELYRGNPLVPNKIRRKVRP